MLWFYTSGGMTRLLFGSSRSILTTVMSSSWPNAIASLAIAAAFIEIDFARSNPNNSPFLFCASTMPSE